MPDKSNLLNNLKQVQESLHSQVFSNRGSSSNVLFPQLSYSGITAAPKDALGSQAYLGASAVTTKLHGMTLTERGVSDGSGFLQTSAISAGDMRGAMGAFTKGGHVASDLGDVTIPWERDMFTALTRKGLSQSTHVNSMTAVVPAKGLLQKFFPGLSSMAASTKAEDIESLVRTTSMSGGIEAGSGMEYLDRARKMLIDEEYANVSKLPGFAGGAVDYNAALSPGQVSQMVTYGAYMQSEARGTIPFFKQVLANHGVENLSGTTSGVWAQTDPYSLARAIKSKTRSWAVYATASGTGPAGMNTVGFKDFFDRVEGIAGSRYRGEFETIMSNLYQESGGKIAMALDETGSVYVGTAGTDLSGFKPIPIGFVDRASGVGASSGGMTSGIYKLEGKVGTVRPTLSGGQVESPVMLALRAFEAGTQQVLGTRPENVGIALSAGYQNMRRSDLITSDTGIAAKATTFGDLTNPIVSQGQRSIYGSLFDQGTVRVAENQLFSVNEALGKVFKDVASGKVTTAERFHSAVRTSIESLPEHVQQSTSMQMVKFSRMAWPALKHEIKKGNVLPSMMLEDGMFLPGELSTKRAQSKGFYQARGIQEIWRPQVLSRIGKTSKSMGMHGNIRNVGATFGEYRIGKAMNAAYAPGSVMSDALGAAGGAKPMSHVMSPVVVLHNGMSPAANLRLTGDAGALLTKAGSRSIGWNMSASRQIEKMMTVGETVGMLEDIAGRHASMPAWQDYISRVREQGVRPGLIPAGQGLPIDPSAINRNNLSYGTTHFLGASWSDYDAERKLSFGRGASRDHVSGLLGGSARYTAVTEKAGFAEREFGDLARYSHMITTKETVGGIDPFRMDFQHRSNLLGTMEGNLSDNVNEFISQYRKHGGKGLVARGGQVVAGRDLDQQNYMKASKSALESMGFYNDEIRAKAGAMIRRLGGSASDFGNVSAEAMKHARLFLTSHSERFGAAEEIVSQANPFSIKLQTLNQMAQSFGQKNPMYVLMSRTFEHQTGIKLSRTDLSPNGYVNKASIPAAIKAPFMPLVDNGGFNAWAGMNNMSIMDSQQMSKRYGQEVGLNAINNKMPYDELMSTSFMSEGRAGFFLDLGMNDVNVPMSGGHVNAGHVYIPSGSEMARGVRGVAGEPVTLGKESLEYGVFKLLSAVSSGSQDDIRDSALQVLGRQMSGGTKGGYLEESVFKARAETAGRGRILPHIGGGAMSNKSMSVAGHVRRDMYNVGMSRTTMMQMFRNKNGGLDVGAYAKARRQMKKEGFIYGSLMPTPTHGAGHVNLVRFYMDRGLGEGGQMGYRMSDFLASMMERDFDKDTIEAMLFSGAHNKKIMMDEYGSESAARRALDDAFTGQQKRHNAQLLNYELGKKEWDKLFDSKAPTQVGTDEFYRRASSLLTFGNLPPMPWLPYYSQLSFSSKLVSQQSAENIALQLTKENGANLQKAFGAEDIKAFQNAMKTQNLSARQVWSESVLAFQSTAQSAIAKGGAYLGALSDYMNVAPETEELLRSGAIDIEGAIQRQIGAAQDFFGSLIDGKSLGKLKLHSEIYAGKSAQEAAMLAGSIVGRAQGVHMAAKAGHMAPEKTFKNLIRGGIAAAKANAVATIEYITGHDISNQVVRTGKNASSSAQDGITLANKGAVSRGLSFLGEHWKGAAVVGGGLLAARAAYGAMGGNDMEAPPMRMPRPAPAPLPPEPMVGRNAPGPSMFSRPQEVRMSNPNGHLMMNSSSGSRNAVNINEMQVNVNTSAVASNISHTNIQDSRRYSSNWEMANAASMNNRSDFIHQYQS